MATSKTRDEAPGAPLDAVPGAGDATLTDLERAAAKREAAMAEASAARRDEQVAALRRERAGYVQRVASCDESLARLGVALGE